MDFWVLIWKGIQFHYWASWAGCCFGLEAFKRVWRLVMSCLNVWHNLMFFKRNLSNIMELFHDVSFNNCCLQNEMKQGLFLQECREINYFVLINRGRVWRSQQHSPPPPNFPWGSTLYGLSHHKGPRKGWGWGSFSPSTFSDGNFFFFGYPQMSPLQHRKGLVIWQYWTPPNRLNRQTLSCSCCQ